MGKQFKQDKPLAYNLRSKHNLTKHERKQHKQWRKDRQQARGKRWIE